MPRTTILQPISFCFLMLFIPAVFKAQGLKLSNATEHLVEGVAVADRQIDRHVFHMGWLRNYTDATWNNHRLRVGLQWTHGGQPSAAHLKDIQTFSNIEAGLKYGFYELFYAYEREKLWLKLGQQDINTDLLRSSNGLAFTHSSFGLDPLIAVNLPGPTYPYTALSLTSGINWTPTFATLFAVFDGRFGTPEQNLFQIDWRLNANDGYLFVFEPALELWEGRYVQKIGTYLHTGPFQSFYPDAGPTELWGVYQVNDIELLTNGKRRLGLFSQINIGAPEVSKLNAYGAVGAVLDNPFGFERFHRLSCAVGHVGVNPQAAAYLNRFPFDSESVVEVNYEHWVFDWFLAKPYVHFIVRDKREGATRESYVIGLRVEAKWEFVYNSNNG